MEKYYSQIIGAEVITEEGARAGFIQDVVLHPDTGKIEGFLLAHQRGKVIAARDLLFWNDRILIKDLEDVSDISDIIKIQQVLNLDIRIFKNRVVTKKGQYLGYVLDFTIDTHFFVLTKILVAKTFLGLFPYEEKTIIFQDILEIKKDRIIVKNPLRFIPLKEKKAPGLKGKLHIDVAPTS